ncbi:MAG: polyphosphate kinase 1 [Verrucomicrobiota bacterium]
MKRNRYFNRELSWLEFNQRVLDEAASDSLPLLERLKFLAISASNLDEFFTVRVGGLKALHRSGSRARDLTGLTPNQQLRAIRARAKEMIEAQYRLLNEALLPSLRQAGITRLRIREIAPPQLAQLEAYFEDNLYPLLTPIAFDPENQDFEAPALQVTVACELEPTKGGPPRYAILPLPPNLPRRVNIPESAGYTYVKSEDLVASMLHLFFPEEKVRSTGVFRIIRNGDIVLEDEDTLDLAGEMEDVLAARQFGETVRVDITSGVSRSLSQAITTLSQAQPSEVNRVPGIVDLTSYMDLAFSQGFDELKVPEWPIRSSPDLPPQTPLFEAIAEKDILLYHPFESFEPIVQLLEESARDPDVLAIKQILYRTAKRSRIIDALIRAAENGKSVVVLVELKARFDEARNIERAEELRRAGVQIIYGVKGLKTHAKICLVIRNERGHLRRYCHFGTGNYNEGTAKLYTDVSLLTAHPDYGTDASAFFNAVSGRSKIPRYRKIFAAPHTLKPRLLELIASEAERARQGQTARILAKINSLQDPEIIDALYIASQAGVDIQLNIRGICCLRPGVKGLSENIRVLSLIDRYLEHARILCFHQGGLRTTYLSSADWMVRNLDKRVELMVPIEEKAAKKRVLAILENYFKDNLQACEIQADGSYRRLRPKSGQKRIRAQEELHKKATAAAKRLQRSAASELEPHRPS